MALQAHVLPGAVLFQLERTGTDRLTVKLFRTIGFGQLRAVFRRHDRRIVGGQVPEERGIRALQAKFDGLVVQLTHAFDAVGEL